MATTKVNQGGNKSNNVYSLPSQISKISDKISQKINPQKSSKDFDVQNPERSLAMKPPRTATHGHKFPVTRRFLIQICTNLRIFLQNWCHHYIHWPLIYKTQENQPQKSSHTPPSKATIFQTTRSLVL